MNSLEKLIYEHQPISLYDLNEESLVYKELAAYAAQLQELEDNMALILREMFIDTAVSKGVKRYKELFGLSGYSDEQAKSIIKTIYNNHYGFWNRALFDQLMEVIPKAVGISESYSNQRVSVVNFSELELGEKSKVISLLRNLLPCYLNFRFLSKAFNWNELEAFQYDFSKFDNLALTFDELEYN